ncbi:MAG: hypothetical protein D8M58_14980 [Calditrichaeota bacterium]|nr:MAG: hypothetical protein DWQ03_16220 [Calditrichota bacterium]MBL1206707.1 hypothetical protein [Calditrichota bacterium]NOG46533.1 hypothetical protein [Calditrichota bacterium]
MKKQKFFLLAFFCGIFLFASNTIAQVADTTQTDFQVADDGVVEAGEAVIKIEVEKPQVQLFSQRIKPEFDEVNLEKSFLKEILDEGQTLKVKSVKEDDAEKIDIKKLLNRNR